MTQDFYKGGLVATLGLMLVIVIALTVASVVGWVSSVNQRLDFLVEKVEQSETSTGTCIGVACSLSH
jgi:uncharacterized membrane protein YqgA involved in biofilm formation